jgi:quercetin dioxygenase-like cupin family protein
MTVVPPGTWEVAQLEGRRSADPLAGLPADSSLRVVRLHRTAGRHAHVHPHSEEVVYVVAGTGHVWIEGERSPVTPGDVVHVPTGAAHATVPDPGSDMELVCFFPHPDLSANLTETTYVVDPDPDAPEPTA